jgi:hypothetical protein
VSIQIHELRLSCAWFERWGDLWSPGKSIAMQFLREPNGYAREFNQMMSETVKLVQAGKPVPPARLTATALTPPWPYTTPQYRQWFWRYFLQNDPASLTGDEASQKLVPFRTRFPAKILSAKSWIRVIADGFIYPHGVGLVMTLRLYFDRGEWPAQGIALERAVQNAVVAYAHEKYDGAWDDSKTFSGTLDTLADTLLDHLRERVLGPGVPPGTRTLRPFSVASVIRGSTEQTETAPKEGGDVHAALQGLCNLRTTWQADSLNPFAKSLLRVRQSAPKSHVLYYTAQGRAVWYPVSFTATGPYNRTVGCYHRNLTLLHLQTEALLQALTAAADLTKSGKTVPPELRKICADAAIQLSGIYSSETSTYRSSSPRIYLDENPVLKKLVNTALAEFKQDPLKYEVAPT